MSGGQEALRAAMAAGEGQGVAPRDAKRLLAHAAGVDAARLMALGAAELSADVMARYGQYLARRATGEPVSKITGKRAFWNHEFLVTADVLDPRADTETLVAKALERDFTRVLDLGTGTGCILLSLLAERAQASGMGVDISPAALQVARENAARTGVGARADLRLSDWFDAVEGRFDLITANPPYITEAEMADLSPEVRDHDPHLALTPGGDGLEPYRIIARAAPAHLAPQGRILVEMGWRQGPQVAQIFAQAGFRDIETVQDFEGRDRVTCAALG
ncbi:peptide chain release factor N(5)-glutamine methyltransferase [Litorivita sp. NS0012-18]|uniref:peptide chain release factor N(5)-glutamine methyltransferase n=1 Tax=Litorivita sp. NS0012-18 TaxID=3127655 RepID=UPI00310898CB